jgi:hypothetical protein
MTMEDPQALEKPYRRHYVHATADWSLMEFICAENDRIRQGRYTTFQ